MLNECLRKSAFCFSPSTQYIYYSSMQAGKQKKKEMRTEDGKEKEKWRGMQGEAMEWSTDGI